MKSYINKTLSVLLVDDSLSERQLFSFILKKMNCNVLHASNHHEAIDQFSQHSDEIDLILLDISMPGKSGFETAKEIRIKESLNDDEWHPIIFISGRHSPIEIEKGIEAGGDDYLVKPVESIILKAKITSMLRIADMRTSLIQAKKQLEKIAHTDELTRVPNRRSILSTLDHEISRSTRYEHPLSIAYLDIDFFKKFNDEHGHKMGDEVLKLVTSTLSESLRREDTLGRLGGEEFLIILPSTDCHHAIQSCNRYRQTIEQISIPNGDNPLKVTMSFGISTFDDSSDSASILLARADSALYKAKESGRNCVSFI